MQNFWGHETNQLYADEVLSSCIVIGEKKSAQITEIESKRYKNIPDHWRAFPT